MSAQPRSLPLTGRCDAGSWRMRRGQVRESAREGDVVGVDAIALERRHRWPEDAEDHTELDIDDIVLEPPAVREPAQIAERLHVGQREVRQRVRLC